MERTETAALRSKETNVKQWGLKTHGLWGGIGIATVGWMLTAAPTLACDLQPDAEGEIGALKTAISELESGHDYQAVNPDSGTLGRWQVLPENVLEWSQETLGYALSSDEFLASPELQDQIVACKLAQYYEEGLAETGDPQLAKRFTAAKWYSGEGSLWQDVTPQFYNGQAYPSIAEYSRSVAELAE